MKHFTCLLLVAAACVADAHAQRVTRDIPYATAHERQVLDVYAPAGAKNLPVVFWIHGGGWQAGRQGAGRSSSRRPSWTRASSSSRPTTACCRTSTWATIIRDVAKAPALGA